MALLSLLALVALYRHHSRKSEAFEAHHVDLPHQVGRDLIKTKESEQSIEKGGQQEGQEGQEEREGKKGNISRLRRSTDVSTIRIPSLPAVCKTAGTTPWPSAPFYDQQKRVGLYVCIYIVFMTSLQKTHRRGHPACARRLVKSTLYSLSVLGISAYLPHMVLLRMFTVRRSAFREETKRVRPARTLSSF